MGWLRFCFVETGYSGKPLLISPLHAHKLEGNSYSCLEMASAGLVVQLQFSSVLDSFQGSKS